MHTSLNGLFTSPLQVREEIIHTAAQGEVELTDNVKMLKTGGHLERLG